MKRLGLALLWFAAISLTACQSRTPTAPSGSSEDSKPGVAVSTPASGVHDESSDDHSTCDDGHDCEPSHDDDDVAVLSAKLTASPTTIQPGEYSTLTWTTTRATAVYLNGVAVTLNGSRRVTPTSTRTYYLVAVNGEKRVTSSATVTVSTTTATKPTAALTAMPASIQSGQSSTLAWATANATSVTLDGVVASANGSKSLSPTATTTYTLVATNSAGSTTTTATITVSVVTPPPVPMPTASLTATPANILSGQSSTLSWMTKDAATVTLDGATVSASGSQVMSPSATTSYTLKATNVTGSVTSTATITVSAPVPQPTASLTASPPSIMSGQTSTLSWVTADASTVSLNQSTVPATGMQVVSPTTTTTYTLTATNVTGSVTATATVTVLAPAPAITYLTNATMGQPSIKQIMDGNCIMCHGGSQPTAGRDFSTYQGVMSVVTPGDPNSRIIQMTRPGAPMHGYLQPDSAGRAQIIYDWIVLYGAKQQ